MSLPLQQWRLSAVANVGQVAGLTHTELFSALKTLFDTEAAAGGKWEVDNYLAGNYIEFRRRAGSSPASDIADCRILIHGHASSLPNANALQFGITTIAGNTYICCCQDAGASGPTDPLTGDPYSGLKNTRSVNASNTTVTSAPLSTFFTLSENVDIYYVENDDSLIIVVSGATKGFIFYAGAMIETPQGTKRFCAGGAASASSTETWQSGYSSIGGPDNISYSTAPPGVATHSGSARQNMRRLLSSFSTANLDSSTATGLIPIFTQGGSEGASATDFFGVFRQVYLGAPNRGRLSVRVSGVEKFITITPFKTASSTVCYYLKQP